MDWSQIEFKQIDLSNLDEYGRQVAPGKKHHLFNGPYYKKNNLTEHRQYIEKLRSQLKAGQEVRPNYHLVLINGQVVGACSWAWKSEETNWLEVGIIIYDENNWGQGLGKAILSRWIDRVFAIFPQIIRIGLSTWSGNIGMVKLAEKLGLKLEATYRQARIVKGLYYDAVSYGILRSEWEGQKLSRKQNS